ncbi:HAMP domain-containing protein, partial [Bosea sp. BH3]|uniref:HAMP domain-containing protein n=1 Tax=Bosea sp. BH3 TaxID=2871701 RepID=UPI0021CB21EB
MTKLFSNMSIKTMLVGLLALMGLVVAVLSGQQIWTAYERNHAAEKVATLSDLNKNLFDALVAARLERASMQTSVIQPPGTNQGSIDNYMMRRKAVDTAMASALPVVARWPQGEVKSAVATLQTALAEFSKVRAQVDAEAKQQPAARTKDLPATVFKVGENYLQTLETASTAVEAEIRAAAPTLADLVMVRSLAWSVRAVTGTSGAMVSSILAQNRPFDAKESRAITIAEGNGTFAFNSLRAIADTPQAASEIRAAVAKAQSSYFSGRFQEMRDDLIGKLTSGQTVSLTPDVWRESVVPALETVGDIASAAITVLNNKADTAVDTTFWSLMRYSALFVAALGLTAFGFWLVLSRVTAPIGKMTQVMKTMAEGDLSVAVPYGDRKDEIGAMAGALTVFQENGLRVRALEEQERAAAAARLARAQSIEAVVSDVGEVVAAAAAGDFSARLEITDADEQMQRLVAGINEINAVVDSATTEFAGTLSAIAGGDLTNRVETAYRGKFADLKGAIN